MKFLCMLINIYYLKDGLRHIYEASEQELITAKRRIDELRGLESKTWTEFAAHPMSKLTSEIMDRFCPSLSRGKRVRSSNSVSSAVRLVLCSDRLLVVLLRMFYARPQKGGKGKRWITKHKHLLLVTTSL